MGFTTVALSPGATRTVTIPVPSSAFTAYVGGSSRLPPLENEVQRPGVIIYAGLKAADVKVDAKVMQPTN